MPRQPPGQGKERPHARDRHAVGPGRDHLPRERRQAHVRRHLTAYRRGDTTLVGVDPAHGYVSPRLGIRFDLSGDELAVFGPDGGRFFNPEEIAEIADALRTARSRADRLAEPGRKLRAGQATDEELQEFDRLTASPPA